MEKKVENENLNRDQVLETQENETTNNDKEKKELFFSAKNCSALRERIYQQNLKRAKNDFLIDWFE